MSRLVFATILQDVLSGIDFHVDLAETDREQLYHELLYYFGLAGGLNVCEALEAAWRDAYNQNEIKDFIMVWLRKKAKKAIRATGIVRGSVRACVPLSVHAQMFRHDACHTLSRTNAPP